MEIGRGKVENLEFVFGAVGAFCCTTREETVAVIVLVEVVMGGAAVVVAVWFAVVELAANGSSALPANAAANGSDVPMDADCKGGDTGDKKRK